MPHDLADTAYEEIVKRPLTLCDPDFRLNPLTVWLDPAVAPAQFNFSMAARPYERVSYGPMVRPATPRLELFCRATVRVASPVVIGSTPLGERRTIAILEGRFEGRLNGEVVPGGADWQIIASDGTAYLDAQYVIRTADGALIYVRNSGIRHGSPEVMKRIALGEIVNPSEYYFRSTPRFETGDPGYAWLNKIIAVCSGARTIDSVLLDFYEVK